MDLNIQIPDNTASIFEYLQKGLFISSNSTSEEVRDMYNEIDENYESLYHVFLTNKLYTGTGKRISLLLPYRT